AAAAAAWATTLGGRPSDPASVAAVLTAAHDPSPPASVVVEGRTVVLVRDLLDGREVTVGRSDVPFPMPAGGHHLGDEPDAPWVAQRGPMTVVCLSRPPESLLLAAELPAERLIAWARQIPLVAPVPR
ncbi:MAG: hypothetical protein ACRD2W_06715, partial [Acidimicrobiales bacterium]